MLANKPSYKSSNLGIAPKEISELKNCLLESFDCILTGKRVHLNMKKVLHIIANDLNISVNNISSSMKCILSECLCYYMKIWPGWKTYRLICSDTKVKENYQTEFKEYLILKLNYVIENEVKFNSDYSADGIRVCERIPQTSSINNVHESEAPYSLVISGKPYFLNNIGFIESQNNIVIKPHTGRPWKCLNIRQFLNYPFMQVCIKLPDLELTRENSHLFKRYISNCEDVIECPPTNYIDFVRRKDLEDHVTVYTVDFISAYYKQFIELVKNQYQISKCKILELEMILKQFLWDVEESNLQQSLLSSGKIVNTMATNVTVCFNIGGHTYIRNKKMCVTNDHTKKRSVNIINFSEILIPKMMFTLNKFVAEEDDKTNDTSFKSLNEMALKLNQNYHQKLNFTEIIHNSVSYSCLLCSVTCKGREAYNEIVAHFSSFHKGEQSVVCIKCRKEFAIANLAGSRWTHDCKKQEVNSPNSAPLTINDKAHHSNIEVVTRNGDLSLIQEKSSIADEMTGLGLNSTSLVTVNTLPVDTMDGIEVCNM